MKMFWTGSRMYFFNNKASKLAPGQSKNFRSYLRLLPNFRRFHTISSQAAIKDLHLAKIP